MSKEMSDIYQALDEVFCDVFGVDNIKLTPETTADQIAGWDSFKQIEIILAIGERFSIRIPTREVDNFKNVGDLAASIEAALRRNAK